MLKQVEDMFLQLNPWQIRGREAQRTGKNGAEHLFLGMSQQERLERLGLKHEHRIRHPPPTLRLPEGFEGWHLTRNQNYYYESPKSRMTRFMHESLGKPSLSPQAGDAWRDVSQGWCHP